VSSGSWFPPGERVRRRPGRGSKAALAQALTALTADPGGCGRAGVRPLGAVVDCVVAARRLAGWSLWVELAGLATLLAFWEAHPPLADPGLVDPGTGELADPDPLAECADPDLADRLSCLVGGLQLPADVHLGELAELFVTSEISAATGASQTATGQRLDAARALFLDNRLPRTRALLRAGLLDWTKLCTLLTGTSDLDLEVARAVEARLIPDPDLALAAPEGPADPLDVRADPAHPGANLPAITRITNPALERAMGAAIAAIDAAALTECAARARTRRAVRAYPTQDCMARLEIEAAQEAVAAVMNDLDAAVATAKATGDTRTPDQIRTDTAIARLTRGAHARPATPDQPANRHADMQADTSAHIQGQADEQAGQGEPTSSCPRCSQPHRAESADRADPAGQGGPAGPGMAVSLTMTLSTWLGLAEEPAVLDRYGAIPAALARQIAREAARDHPTTTTWRCIITSDNHRSVLAVADPLRTPHHDPPPRLRRLIDTIHPRCVFPGCPRTARRCDHDHRTPYENGGATCSCNIQPLCRGHHRLKSIGLITAQPIPDPTCDPTAQAGATTDALAWTTATGHTYRYDAPPPLPEPHDSHDRELATTRHHQRRREQNSVDPDTDQTGDSVTPDARSWIAAVVHRQADSRGNQARPKEPPPIDDTARHDAERLLRTSEPPPF
jgi:hypothetical protein